MAVKDAAHLDAAVNALDSDRSRGVRSEVANSLGKKFCHWTEWSGECWNGGETCGPGTRSSARAFYFSPFISASLSKFCTGPDKKVESCLVGGGFCPVHCRW